MYESYLSLPAYVHRTSYSDVRYLIACQGTPAEVCIIIMRTIPVLWLFEAAPDINLPLVHGSLWHCCAQYFEMEHATVGEEGLILSTELYARCCKSAFYEVIRTCS